MLAPELIPGKFAFRLEARQCEVCGWSFSSENAMQAEGAVVVTRRFNLDL